ncbi:hypothetical protein Nepgr_016344 [Nepenthes gracilis]|uniref:Uncharacterized protein n=1 Tax=Nepenthes gracilis TaxID=150966 RepID=A0AAD3XRJ1_NEPGR|nr:hypothetical protein Nepgr_016344 [Nepenthes gracilis]
MFSLGAVMASLKDQPRFSVAVSPHEHSLVELDSAEVKVPLSPLGPSRTPEPPGETCSENNWQLLPEGCEWLLILILGLESTGIPTFLIEPCLVKLRNLGRIYVLQNPAFQLVLPTLRFFVAGIVLTQRVLWWEVRPVGDLRGHRKAALDRGGCPLDLCCRQLTGFRFLPRSPIREVDTLKTPPSISRILTKYSLDTPLHLGHGSSSPNSMCVASSGLSPTIGGIIFRPASETLSPRFWQTVKSRRKRNPRPKLKGLTLRLKVMDGAMNWDRVSCPRPIMAGQSYGCGCPVLLCIISHDPLYDAEGRSMIDQGAMAENAFIDEPREARFHEAVLIVVPNAGWSLKTGGQLCWGSF